MKINAAELKPTSTTRPDNSTAEYTLGEIVETGWQTWIDYELYVANDCEEITEPLTIHDNPGGRVFQDEHGMHIAWVVD